MCSIRSMGEIGLQLEFGSAPNVRVSARIRLRLKVKCQILAKGIGLVLVVR